MENKVILLVDDDPSITDLYKERLEMEKFKVIVAKDGNEAIEKLSKEKPDLILLDIMMPKIGGLDVLDVIKSRESSKNIPVIMLTVLIHDEPQINSLIKGADDYVVKTKITPKELVEKIKDTIK